MSVVDHVAQMLARLPEQFKEKTGWTALITALGGEVQELEDALQDLLTLRSVNTATGAALEQIGNLVGEAPSGLDDEIYRRRIRARITANRSRGTVEDLIGIARLVLTDGTDTPGVELVRQRCATVVVRSFGEAIADDVADVAIDFLRAATRGGGEAGVRVLFESSTVASPFAFDTGPAFDVGLFADVRE